MKNQTRCVKHGGGTPQARRKAEERGQLESARAAVARMGGGEAVTDPFRVLAEVLGEAVAFKDELRARHGTPGADAAYERSLDRLARLLPDAIRAGLQARQLEADMERWASGQAEAAVALVFGLAADLGHDGTDPAVQAAITARLDQFSAGTIGEVRGPRRLTRR